MDIGESITSGVINAASGVVFGNRPLRSVRDAFWRGGKAGATTAAINNLANALRGNRTSHVPNRSTNGWQSAIIGRDPKTLCGSQSPFEGTFGYRSEYQNGNGTQSRNGFDLGSFVKDTAVGFVMGGLTSVTFYGAGKAVDALQNSVRSVHKSGKKTDTLYHYTNEKGMNGIVDSKQLNPSLKANNPKDARYGDGQYLSDIKPDTQTPVSLSKKFINVPNKYKYTHYVEIDVTDLNVIQGRDGVLVIPNESPLDLTNRLVGTGVVGK